MAFTGIMRCVNILELDPIIGANGQFNSASAAPIMTTVLLICLSWVKFMEVTVLWMVGRDLNEKNNPFEGSMQT